MELKNRISISYDYHYNQILKDFEIKNINSKKITMEHLKVVDQEKDDLIKEFIQGKFRLVKYQNNTAKLIRYHDSFPVLVKITPYENKKDMLNLKSLSNNDSYISYLLSEKILQNKINLVLLPLVNFDVKFNEIKDIINTYPEIKWSEEINNGKFIDNVSVRVREAFFKIKSLEEFLKENKCNIYDIFYQVVLTIGQIRNYYPKFSHNNLNLNSVYIYEMNDKCKEKQYSIGNDIYTYASPGYEIRISDFEKSDLNSNKSNDINNFGKVLLEHSNLFCEKNIIELIKKISSNDNNMKPKEILKSLNDTRKLQKTNYQGIKLKGKISKDFGDINFMDKKIKRKFRKSKNTQSGGSVFKPSGRNIPNNPNLSNDQRMSFKKLQMDRPKSFEPPILAEQKVYQPSSKPPPKPNPNMYPPLHIPATHPSYQIQLPYQYDINKLPIQNIYNISMADPRGDHSRLARIYENMVPGKEYGLSSVSLLERSESSNFIKSIMVDMRDGKDVSLSGGEGSLLEHIYLTEINPYHYTNPYDDLPIGDFLLYTSAYPVRYDNDKERLTIAKNSVGLNLRMYGLTVEELRAHYSGHGVSSVLTHNPWIELEYYKKINDIVKNRKLTPNLVMMHFWVLDSKSRIKYDEIKKIKNKKIITDTKIKEISDIEKVYSKMINERLNDLITNDVDRKKFNDLKLNEFLRNKIHSREMTDEAKKTFADIIRLNYDDENDKRKINSYIEALRRETEENLSADSKVSLGIITESPTSTFVKWASPIYSGSGSLKTMTQTGYHEYKVYESLLFQYIFGMSVLQQENIAFENFDPLFNLFVKDIYTDDRDTKHWRYVVDGVEYFVPNYGYIGMIDSFYGGKDSNITKPKIILDDKDNKIFENFKKIIDINFYQNLWREKGGHPVPKEFLDLLNKLNSLSSENIKDYLKEFRNLLNNRIGEKVTITEFNNIDITRFPRNIKPGTLVARKEGNVYKWAVVLSEDSSLGIIKKYLVQIDKNKEPQSLPSAQLFMTTDMIEPKPLNGVKYDSYNMLEKYEI